MAVTKSTLLEMVLLMMKEETITFTKKIKRKNYKHMESLKTDLTAANNTPNVDHDEVRRIEAEITEYDNNDIREALENRKSFRMFEDEKPTSTFLKMETSKGYSEVTRLRIPNKFFNDKLPEHPLTNIKYFIVTDQSLIRLEMQAAFQSIYNNQDMLATSSNDLLNFLNSDNDIRPRRRVHAKKTNPTHGELHGGTPNRGRT